jgi:hypothetical protein
MFGRDEECAEQIDTYMKDIRSRHHRAFLRRRKIMVNGRSQHIMIQRITV